MGENFEIMKPDPSPRLNPRMFQAAINLFVIVVLPWAVWVTSTLYHRDVRISILESRQWIGKESPETLRLSVLADTEAKLGLATDRIVERLDKLAVVLNDLKLDFARHTSSTK